ALRRSCVVLRLPAPGRVGAEDRALDERRRLLGQRHRQRLVEQPDERSPDAVESLRGRCARSAQRLGVDLLALADSRCDETRCLELTVQVEEDRLATLSPQLAGLAQTREAPAELAVH